MKKLGVCMLAESSSGALLVYDITDLDSFRRLA